jgi:hypothetical protein
MGKRAKVLLLSAAACVLGAAPQQQPDLGIPVFPADNPWNWDITGLAVHPNSGTYVASIGASTPIREDYAFPYSVVLNAQADVAIPFTLYADESDPGPLFGSPADGTLSTGSQGMYPFPSGAPIEGGGDAHCLVIDKDNRLLYETYVTSGGPPWSAACGAVHDLNSNAVRPDGWTSADAAGLPIFPGLIRYEEIAAGQISHALRFTCGPTQDAHLYPARHHAGVANTNYPPMGLRFRLKASKDISGYTGAARVILEALKKHGMIVADNGSDWYISTTIDSRWASTNITQIRDMVGSDFEAVVTVDASGNPILPVSGGGSGPPPPPPPSGGGRGGGGGCGWTGLEALLMLALVRRSRRG